LTLGFYTRSFELVRFPATVFGNVAGTVLFSAFTRLKHAPERLARVYRRVLAANAALLGPATVGLWILAPEGVELLLGPGWQAVVTPFRILVVTMAFRTSYKLSYTV